MRKNLKQLLVAMEEQATGKANFEREYVFYAKLSDKSILEKASHMEEQEQRSLKIAKTATNHASGTIRIRRTDDNGKISYIQTTKTPVKPLERDTEKSDTVVADASQNMLEVAIDASEDAFNQFKLIADHGMKKTRYTFPIEGTELKFEVDVFDGQDEDAPWVKIDLEVDKPLESIPALPDGFSNIIYNQKDDQTDEEKKLIWSLYENVFLVKNEYLK
jgi:CYTH domain-containing protein